MSTTNKIIVKNAAFIFLGISVYFFLMKLLGLEARSELRFLNFIFVLWGINNAIKTNIHANNENLYVRNLAIGVATSALSVAMSIIGLILYVNLIDSGLVALLQESFLWTGNLTMPLIVFALFVEGMASSVICSFILMQYYKNYKMA
ncbi:hypothetical protein AAON49_08440 [Pseudotenacibaculum sp. MALMAid0570]|uniref:hypothetical protein n=1 Tax=Pseudotenacibaculum sp. MALMAid0570 TaxID=3143938 RepID=UPI0032DF2661